jgi:hypothetical protein
MQLIPEQEGRSSKGSRRRVSLQRTDQQGHGNGKAAATPAAAAGSIAQQHPELAGVAVLLLQLLLSVQQAEQRLAQDDATAPQQPEFDMRGVGDAIREAAAYLQEKMQQHGLGMPVLYLWQSIVVVSGSTTNSACWQWLRRRIPTAYRFVEQALHVHIAAAVVLITHA